MAYGAVLMRILSEAKKLSCEEQKIIWVWQTDNCISFKKVEGYRLEEFKSLDEMWKTVHILVEGGYKVQ